jgi:putative lipoic acid-binding regulatory protein
MTDSHFQKELLESVHQFPCEFMIKVIGKNENQFEDRASDIFRNILSLPFDPPFEMKTTSGNRHCALTFNLEFESADKVLEVYQELGNLDGVVMLL